jgi:hypothetical protein
VIPVYLVNVSLAQAEIVPTELASARAVAEIEPPSPPPPEEYTLLQMTYQGSNIQGYLDAAGACVFNVDWGDGTSTAMEAGTSGTIFSAPGFGQIYGNWALFNHVYSTPGQYVIVVTSLAYNLLGFQIFSEAEGGLEDVLIYDTGCYYVAVSSHPLIPQARLTQLLAFLVEQGIEHGVCQLQSCGILDAEGQAHKATLLLRNWWALADN